MALTTNADVDSLSKGCGIGHQVPDASGWILAFDEVQILVYWNEYRSVVL
jgi:hypothetical protein